MDRRTVAASPAGPDRTAVPAFVAWAALSAATLARALLGMILALTAWAALPALLGWHATTVSSGSMEPRLHTGDIAVSRPLHTTPALNQILLYDDPDHAGRLRMHRLVRLDDHGLLVTKGDANPVEDSTPITPAAIRGIGTLRVPYLGLPIIWTRTHDWLPLTGCIAALITLLTATRLDRRLQPATNGTSTDDDDTTGDDTTSNDTTGNDLQPNTAPAATLKARSGWHRAARTALTAAITLALGAGTVSLIAVPAAARYTRAASNPTATFAAAASYYSCKQAVLAAADPFVFYQFDETSGTNVNDASGNGWDGTIVGGASLGASGACSEGSALTLNGSTGYVVTPAWTFAPNTFTVQTWFKTTSTKGGRLIGFGTSRTGTSPLDDRHLYLTNDGRLVFGVAPGNTVQTISSAAGLNDGGWHLATATLSSAGMKLYVDGGLVASKSSVTSAQGNFGYWRIGADSLTGWTNAPTSTFLAGSIDNAAVYHSALGADDVAAIYAASGR